jgi:hypothetical protein
MLRIAVHSLIGPRVPAIALGALAALGSLSTAHGQSCGTYPCSLEVTGPSAASNPNNALWINTNSFSYPSVGSLIRIGHGGSSGNTYGVIDNLTTGGTVYGNLALQQGGGNVGIGTTTPSNNLTIGQSSDSQNSGGLRLYSRAGADSGTVLLQGADHNTYFFNMGGGPTGNISIPTHSTG